MVIDQSAVSQEESELDVAWYLGQVQCARCLVEDVGECECGEVVCRYATEFALEQCLERSVLVVFRTALLAVRGFFRHG